MGSAMVLLDRVMVSSYRLSIVTIPPTEAVWPQFTMQVFGSEISSPFGGMGRCRGSELVLQGSGQATLLFR